MMDKAEKEPEEMSKKRYSFLNKRVGIYALIIVALIVVLAGGWYGYLYASTPEHIRKPTFQHYHFRTQILVDGQSVYFSKDEFQKEKAVACSAAVGSTPIDFHDKMNQLTHVHWNGMTGGEFLKYFGWNFIGGSDDLMGYRYDAGIMPSPVKIFDKLLPSTPKIDTFYIYAGDKDNYQKKSWDDFLNQDLETFFGKKSNVGHSSEVSSSSVLNWLFPKAYAQGAAMDQHTSNKSEAELTRVNNLIGNVVIFAQEKEPTKEQIKLRFDNLVPLQESTCGD